KPARLLRIHQTHPRKGRFVAEIRLPASVAVVDRFNHGKPPLVVQHAREFRKPGTQPISHAVSHPQPDFGIALNRVFPPLRLLQTHAENPYYGFSAHRCPEFLAVLAICPGSRDTSPSLAVRN